jgi:hypothetical protein
MIATEDQWIALLVETLAELVNESGRAVTGAGLGGKLQAKAAEKGLEQPVSLRRRKFKSFLARLAKDGLILWLPEAGADVLVSSIDKPGLLADHSAGSRRSSPGIRRDLFTAFTWVTDKKPFYSPLEDKIVWVKEGQDPVDGCVAIPAPDFDSLKARASRFVGKLGGELDEEGRIALGHVKPLSSFSTFISSNGLGKAWHEFRTSDVIDSIKKWAVSNDLNFRSDWLTTTSDGALNKPAGGQSDSDSAERNGVSAVHQLLSLLSREDLARINVPLDIVLRFIKER